MSREYGTRSRVAVEQGVSKVVDLPAYSTEESAGPSRPSKRDPPAQVRTYPPWWPYWDDNGTPIPAPLSANGEGKASPSSPQVPAAAERTHGPSNPSASGQPVMEGQESSGQEHHHEPESAWLRRELESLSKLREQGHSFHEISEELLKLGYGKLAGRDAKACELRWSDFHEKKTFIRWTAEEDAELKLFLKDDTMSWADMEEKFCYRGKSSAQNRWRKNPRNFADVKD